MFIVLDRSVVLNDPLVSSPWLCNLRGVFDVPLRQRELTKPIKSYKIKRERERDVCVKPKDYNTGLNH